MIPNLRAAIAVLLPCLLVCTVLMVPVAAAVVPNASPLAEKEFRNPNLHITNLEREVSDLGPPASPQVLERQLANLRADRGRYDWRGGRWGSLVLSLPLVPGDGKGNNVAGARPPSEADVWRALSDYIGQHQNALRVDRSELGHPSITIFEKGNFIQVHVPRVVGGLPVRDSGLTAVINHGNLILLGLQNWGAVDATTSPAVTLSYATGVVAEHLKPFAISGYREAGHLERIPLARGGDVASVVAGLGYDYRLAWVVAPRVANDQGGWEALVDALTGELLAFQDTNQYAVRRVVGGVYPVSNDQRPPDGIEQPGWPMPFANVTGGGSSTTTASGIVTACEPNTITTTLAGPFIRIADVCGAVNETSAAGNIDLGASAGDDCTVPAGGHSAGDTHSARSGFYELNRIKEQAREYLTSGPPNTWINAQLVANMNINNSCNAFWGAGGTVNFYRSNATCGNTGEIAAVFDHEWGHGLDDNGTNGNISSPGEGIADIHATLRLSNSCVGRGFFLNQVCGGYGDPCTGTPTTGCTGVRDADFANHVSGLPHGINWILSNCGGGSGPCGREVHCEGQIVSEAGWDLQFRDMRAAPYNYDENTALELTTRIFYLGAETITSWYTCTASGGGCGATGGYMLMLAADDDNGSIIDGTPHMQAIFNAFNRHQMQCATPAVVDSGCPGGPTTAPTVIATPAPGGVDLTWAPVAGASDYYVFRTEGVSGCSFGKVKAGQTNLTSWSDSGLLDGRQYSYSVLPVGANSSCFGRMSVCAAVTPTAPLDPCVATNASVSFASPNSTVAEAGVNATITVTVKTNNGQPTIAPLIVNVTTIDGTATAGSDYTAVSGTLTFPTGTVSGATQNVVVPITQETLDETNEDFLVALSNATGGVAGPNVTHVVTIVDDDVPVELQSFVVE